MFSPLNETHYKFSLAAVAGDCKVKNLATLQAIRALSPSPRTKDNQAKETGKHSALVFTVNIEK